MAEERKNVSAGQTHEHSNAHGHTHSHGHAHGHGGVVSSLPKFQKNESGAGTFYGVSVGPGDSELLTLKALRVLMHCPVITAPRTKGETMLALDIAKRGVKTFLEMSFGSRVAEASEETFWAAKRIFALDFPMVKDTKVLKETHELIAAQLEGLLDDGNDIAMLNLGDVTVYSSFWYIARLLKRDGYRVEMCSGVTSFTASAAALGTSLTSMDSPVFILPGSAEEETLRRMLDEDGTKVIMKSGKNLPDMLNLLHEKGLEDRTSAVVNCGLSGEEVYENLQSYEEALAETPETTSSYFTTFLVKDEETEE